MIINKIKIFYHLAEVLSLINYLSESEKDDLYRDRDFKSLESNLIDHLLPNISQNTNDFHKTSYENSIKKYDFEFIMNNLRNQINQKKITYFDNLSSIEWLLKFLLKEPSLFSSVSELDIFLSNITGLRHATKSTGRDRIVDWYFKEINLFYNKKDKNKILFNILKYIVITYRSDYREWSNFLTKIKG
jgi:hypothetical protein